jgi:heme/copper-type cytochrome/quinol oxidase subunit 2
MPCRAGRDRPTGGLDHARMVFSARVLQHRQFDEWLADQQAAVGDGT